MKYIKTYEIINNKLKIDDIITFPYDVGKHITAFKPYKIFYTNDSEYIIKDNNINKYYIDKFDGDIIHVTDIKEIELLKNIHKYNL